MRLCKQEHLTERCPGHTDRYMILRLFSEARDDQALLVLLAGSAVGNEQTIRFRTAYQLRSSGQAHTVCPGTSDFGEFRRGRSTKPLQER